MSQSGKEQNMILCIDDIRQIAASKLTKQNKDFFNDGATKQVTVRENEAAYAKYRIRPRVLRNVQDVDPSTTVFGRRIDFPVCVAPAGLHGIAHTDGELATSRACARRKVNMGVSTFATYSVEQIRAAGQAAGGLAHAMQLYTMQDRALQERIIRRAEAAGCTAILLTADSPVLGVRYAEVRGDFRIPAGLSLPVLERSSEVIRSRTHDEGFSSFNSSAHSWAVEIPWLRSKTRLQIWIKGVLTADDVCVAVKYGCDGVIVSNHGGRQLDEVPATMDVLAECVAAAAGRIKVHIDGGVRTGTDIFKAVALGADCVWIGRPVIWGLAYDGEKGVSKVLDILYDEFRRCMQLAGCNSVSEITTECIGRFQRDGPLARL